MKVKIFIIIFVIVLLISGGLLTLKFNDNKSVVSVEQKESKIVDSENDQFIEDGEEEQKNEKIEVVENNETTKKVESKSSENKKVESNTQQKQEVKTTTKQETPKEQTTQKQETTKPVETTKPKEKPIWEVLGMTEYQYYNEPMYSWEKVDFPVSKYGSESAAREACAQYGDKYEPYLNGEVAYHCTTVNTASGKYLGEWFHTENVTR